MRSLKVKKRGEPRSEPGTGSPAWGAFCRSLGPCRYLPILKACSTGLAWRLARLVSLPDLYPFMSVPTSQSLTSLPPALQRLVQSLSATPAFTPAQARQALLAAEVTAADLAPWASLDHAPADSYGRRLVWLAPHFEIMVMSWDPGDYSAIHDHGHTQWGAVQVFGPAEHATFRWEGEALMTLSRQAMTTGAVIGVSHRLIHQMGNPTPAPFLSLHVYGGVTESAAITGDARLFEAATGDIHRVDGGVFFALPASAVKRREPGPTADFPTRLRYLVELGRRLARMGEEAQAAEAAEAAFAASQLPPLRDHLATVIDTEGHVQDQVAWRLLTHELREAAAWQRARQGEVRGDDAFHRYAALYDAVICQPCLDTFIGPYLDSLVQAGAVDFRDRDILSVGCGTGLVEAHLIRQYSLDPGRLLGLDLSAAMIAEARQRIRAAVGDVRHLTAEQGAWDLVFSGLNVFHYLPAEDLPAAIARVAAVVRPGGVFVGDFITPDHIRWYPHLIYSTDRAIASLRTPRLVEEAGRMYQESDILNVDGRGPTLAITYAGRHRRFLPPMHRVRHYFEAAFGGEVQLFDAHSLAPLPPWADSCSSTRYVVLARKAGG